MKTNTHSFKLNTIFSIGYKIFQLVTPFITSPYVSRVLGNENLGIYSYDSSIVYFFSMIALFGFYDYGNLMIARAKNREETTIQFWNVFLSKSIFGFASLALFIIAVFSVDSLRISSPIFLALGTSIIGTILDVSYLFAGKEEYVTITIKDFIVKILSIICTFLFVRNDSRASLIAYCLILNGSTIISALTLFASCHKHLSRIKLKGRIAIWGSIKGASVFFIPTLLTAIPATFNKTLIGLFSTTVQNGYYEQALKLITICTTLLTAINSIVTSRMAKIISTMGEENIEPKIEKIVHFILVGGLPCVAGVVLVAPFFVPLFYGEEYMGAIPIVYSLSPLIIFMPLETLLTSVYFVPLGLRGKANWYSLIAVVFDLALCFALIPFLKGIGAAIAYSVSEFVFSAVEIFILRNKFDWKKIFKNSLFKPLISSSIMTIFVLLFIYFIPSNNLFLLSFGIAGIGVISYAIGILLLKDSFVLELVIPIRNKIFEFIKKKNK